jgi:hypothetical protein
VSKGQCGVTSAFIARYLSDAGYDVLFCEGDVAFPSPTNPIRNHCWVKIRTLPEQRNEIRDIIIDLTADQSGFSEPVICESDESLRNRGIFYKQEREVEPMTAQSGKLSSRLNKLQQQLNSLGANRGE